MKSITLYDGNHPMDDIFDEILDAFEDRVDQFKLFETIVGSASLGGIGDKFKIRINIVYDDLDQQQAADVDAIIAIAEKRANSLEVIDSENDD